MFAEHADAGRGSLQGRMATTVQEIDREAARRVAGVLAADEAEEAELQTAELAWIESKPAPSGAWVPRILAAGTLAGVLGAVMLLSSKPEHGRQDGGSLGWADGTRRSRAAVPTEVPSMKSSIQRLSTVASIAGAVTTAANAQQAVQWRVEDGGNGHWYLGVIQDGCTWTGARAAAQAMGGDLVTLANGQESNWVFAQIASHPSLWRNRIGPRIGLVQAPGGTEPAGGWAWCDGTPLTFTAWNQNGLLGQPNPIEGGACVDSDYGGYYAWPPSPMNTWGSYRNDQSTSCHWESFRSYIVEWSADCNGDGIVDYGQILSGQLADSNANFIPDCCEGGPPCPTAPRQWRVQDGGNGHWYAFNPNLVSWQGAREIARARGGELASLTSAAERVFWMSMIPVGAGIPGCVGCAWLGGYQDRAAPDYAEPAGGWRWTDGSPWSYTFWNPGEPNNLNGQDYLYGSGPTNGRWDDSDGLCCGPFVIEWSADCNGDGLVDYGQILSGQLADSDNDGIPNACECTCDVFRDNAVNGIDLGVLLGQWGPANQHTVTDFNGDGAVDGLDLGTLLAAWGPCPG